ncbi:hypothetical protein HOY80DRAFT_1045976 [Tuber brumale]|nr:hypothetical protein HOY80DRAFT_1045976 [Tuber brumale]
MKYIEVLNFMKVQALQECNWRIQSKFILFKTRKQLARQVSDEEGAGQWTWHQILQNEVSWIKNRYIKSPQRGRHSKISSWIEEESTLLAVREYISQAGETVDSMGMTQAISWHLAEMNDDIIPLGRGRIIHDIQRTISSRSSCCWLRKLGFNWKEVRKGVYNDGHEREDVKQY